MRIGSCVRVELPEYMRVRQSIDRFLITKTVQTVGREGSYECEFEGVLDELEAIPVEKPEIPVAYPQIATVVDNADPQNMGRVKVQTQWQKDKNKTTNWLRVSSPDSGGSEKVASNRGLLTIPEVGDTVMLGFEYGNPDRPYVASSIFTAKTGGGGGAGNKTKSLTTRSGSTVTLDDEKGSVMLKDAAGSDSKIKLDGSKNITIEADTSITINIGKGQCIFKMDKNGVATLDTKNQFKVTVGESTLTMTPNDVKLETSSSINISASKNHIQGETKLDGGNVFVN